MDKNVYEFLAKQTSQDIIEWKKCKWCGEEFPIFSGDREKLDKISPKINGKEQIIPNPTLCPSCRLRRRLIFRNERTLYRNICAHSGKSVVTVYAPESGIKVYDKSIWWGDEWTGLDYGLEFDPNIDMFSQLGQLMRKVPRMSLLLVEVDNSDFSNYASYLKNCYLVFDSTDNEDCFYSYNIAKSKNSSDCNACLNLQHCYECINCHNSYKLMYSMNCNNCSDSDFLFNCEGCKNCINCANLINKQYCIDNKQLSKEEYFEKKDIKLKILKQFDINTYLPEFFVGKSTDMFNCENCFGDTLINSKDSYLSYDSRNLEGSVYMMNVSSAISSLDIDSCAGPAELSYELNGSMACYNTLFGIITRCEYSMYIDHGTRMKNCFACVGINDQENCILNKSYSEEEYGNLVEKIINQMNQDLQWGEFFDTSMSPFPYNDTLAEDFFPILSIKTADGLKAISLKPQAISEQDGKGTVTILEPEKFISDAILDLGGEKIRIKWRTENREVNMPDSIVKLSVDELPTIKELQVASIELQDSLLNKAIICEVSGRPFRIVKQELDFYIKHNIELPRRHHDIRFKDRFNRKPSRNMFLRKCDNCDKEVLSVYPDNVKFKVFCEECYMGEVY